MSRIETVYVSKYSTTTPIFAAEARIETEDGVETAFETGPFRRVWKMGTDAHYNLADAAAVAQGLRSDRVRALNRQAAQIGSIQDPD